MDTAILVDEVSEDTTMNDQTSNGQQNGANGSEDEPTRYGEENLSFAELLDQYEFSVPRRGQLLAGHVLTVNDGAILVDVGAKRDAIISRQDLNRLDEDWLHKVSVGDELPVYVLRTPSGTEELEVSLKRGLEEQEWERAEEYLENGEMLELPVAGYNKGGLLVEFGHLRGFVPNSHVPDLRSANSNQEQDEYKGEQIGTVKALKVIEVDRSRRRFVLSEKAAQRQARKRNLRELNVGDVKKGVVESIADFGAFVNIGGGITGLVHISRLDWRRIQKPSEVVSVGDEVEVLVEDVNVERERVRLNRQALLPNPWDVVAEKYELGDIVEGTVSNVVDFGAFVQLKEGVEGLIHVSEMDSAFVGSPKEILQPGEDVRVRIISIEPKRERLGLSMQQVDVVEVDWDILPGGEHPAAEASASEEPEAATEVAVEDSVDDSVDDAMESETDAGSVEPQEE